MNQVLCDLATHKFNVKNDLFYEEQQHTYLKKKKRNNNIAFAIKV